MSTDLELATRIAWTDAALARALGVTRAAVRHWHTGRCAPPSREILRDAAALALEEAYAQAALDHAARQEAAAAALERARARDEAALEERARLLRQWGSGA